MPNLSISNSKQRFAYKLTRFLLVLFILDYSIGYLLKYFYFRQTSGKNQRTTYSLYETCDEILVFGNSRATHHYIPRLFTQTLNYSCYNTGRAGQSLFYSLALQKVILYRHTPQIIILDIRPDELLLSARSYDWLSQLLPYYEDLEEIRSIVDIRSKFEQLKLLSRIYPYNSTLFTTAKYNIVNEKDYNGYLPLLRVMKSAELPVIDKNIEDNIEINNNKVHAFESFILNCLNADIKLFVVISPAYHKKKVNISKIEAIVKTHNVPLWNFLNDPSFSGHSELFYDSSHLNNKGAELFSKMVSDRIKQFTGPDHAVYNSVLHYPE